MEYQIHDCLQQRPGVRIERSRSYFHSDFTWQLVITREATEEDLQNNNHLENVGDEIWSTVVEINNCPFCGEELRKEDLSTMEYAHFDSSGWSIDVT